MEGIHVFLGRDVGDGAFGVEMCRQGHLHKDAADLRVGVKPAEKVLELLLCAGGGQVVVKRLDTHLCAVLALVAHIDRACRVVTHKHDRQAARMSMLLQDFHTLSGLGLDLCRDGLAVENCRHIRTTP